MSKIITAITVQKKNKNRFSIFINDQYAFSLNHQHAAGLKQGDLLSKNRIADLKHADELDTAHSRALFYLNFRPRSRMEIERYLKEKKFTAFAVSDAIHRLEAAGYINDHEFARLWIENRLRLRPKGIYALKGELREKGIDDHIINKVLTDFDETAAAWAAVTPRLNRLKKHERNEFNKKIYAFLCRRGFAYGICREICEQAWEHRIRTAEEEKN